MNATNPIKVRRQSGVSVERDRAGRPLLDLQLRDDEPAVGHQLLHH